MADAFLYVVRRPTDGARKVGFTSDTTSRLYNINSSQGCRCALEYAEARTISVAIESAEKHAHALLWESRVEGEWFAVDLETAQQAVAAAFDAAELGGTMLKPPRGKSAKTETFTVKVSRQWLKDLDDWRRLEKDLPSRTEAIMRMCDKAFAERAPAIEEWYATGKMPAA
jgi:predicted GIY-YIG superfamily endonuclease